MKYPGRVRRQFRSVRASQEVECEQKCAAWGRSRGDCGRSGCGERNDGNVDPALGSRVVGGVGGGTGRRRRVAVVANGTREPPPPCRDSGSISVREGAIASGGSVRNSSTRVTRPASGSGGRLQTSPANGVSATGLGAIAAASDVDGSKTEVVDEGPAAS